MKVLGIFSEMLDHFAWDEVRSFPMMLAVQLAISSFLFVLLGDDHIRFYVCVHILRLCEKCILFSVLFVQFRDYCQMLKNGSPVLSLVKTTKKAK